MLFPNGFFVAFSEFREIISSSILYVFNSLAFEMAY